MFGGGHEKSRELGEQYRQLADFVKVDYFNAGDVISTDGCDGIHFTAENNDVLGKALATKVESILAPKKSAAA